MANLYRVNLFFILFYLLGYNLRHSHIWISYGPRLEQLFISPAQHQIHHSAEERHWDKNMGLILAIWDKAFGTLYVPKGKESFRLGIDSDDQPRFEQSATSLFWLPFVRIKEDWQRLFTPYSNPSPSRRWVSSCLYWWFWAAAACRPPSNHQPSTKPFTWKT
ncbi:MAG: sterol desaturase family protein [Vampirovibrionales bacterium]